MSSFLGTNEFRHYSTSLQWQESLWEISRFSCRTPVLFVSNLVLSWKPWLESEKKWFFSAFFICQEPVGFASLFPWKAFCLSLLFFVLSFFSNSSMFGQRSADSHPENISSHSCVPGMLREWFVMLWFQSRPLTFCRFEVYQVDAHQQVKLTAHRSVLWS